MSAGADRLSQPEARRGHLARVGGFSVFVDEDLYAADIRAALDQGYYEARERDLIGRHLRPGDKVLEAGAGLGVAAMSAAAIVGQDNVVTFDANPEILSDAADNFRRNGFPNIGAHAGLLRNKQNFAPNAVSNFYIDRAFWFSRLDASAKTPGIERVVQSPAHCLEHEIAAAEASVLLCDIEGGEVDLLIGADLSGLRLLIVETHPWFVGAAAVDAMARHIIDAGFSIDRDESDHFVSVFRR